MMRPARPSSRDFKLWWKTPTNYLCTRRPDTSASGRCGRMFVIWANPTSTASGMLPPLKSCTTCSWPAPHPQRLRLISWFQAPDATPTAATLLTALPEPQLLVHIEIREELYRLYLSCHSERKRTRQSRSSASTSSPTAVHPPGNDLATSTTTEATSHNYLEGARMGEAQNPTAAVQQPQHLSPSPAT